MSIPLAVYFALSSSLTHAGAAPFFEEIRMTFGQLLSSVAQTQLPFTCLVIVGVVSLWRGAWGLMDLHIFPNNSSLSYLVSLGIGLVIILSMYDLGKVFL